MKTISIKEREYVPVVERVKEFHRLYPLGEINTEIFSCDDKRVIVKAIVKLGQANPQEKDPLLQYSRYFTGYAQSEWGKGIMGGVALEVAETSAVGRALGFANIGLLDGIASADEMRKVKKVANDDDEAPF